MIVVPDMYEELFENWFDRKVAEEKFDLSVSLSKNPCFHSRDDWKTASREDYCREVDTCAKLSDTEADALFAYLNEIFEETMMSENFSSKEDLQEAFDRMADKSLPVWLERDWREKASVRVAEEMERGEEYGF